MDRSNRSSISQALTFGRHQQSLFAIGLLALVAASGCASAMANVMYIFQGRDDVKAQFAGLSGKRVAVVCRPLATMQYRNANPAKDMGRSVSALLKEHVPKIQLVSRNEIDKWIDENESNFDDFTAIGEALKADLVVGIELESFTIYQGSTTLYQGRADAQVVVYDVKKGGDPVFSARLPQVIYPPNTAVASSDMPEGEFRRRFMAKLAEHVARYFYDHDSSVDFAMDADIASH